MSMVSLVNGHLMLKQELVAGILDNDQKAAWIYFPEEKKIMLAASTNTAFTGAYKTAVSLLKYRNEAGDRSLSIQELLIDNDLNDANRVLAVQADTAMKTITIQL